MLQLYVTSSVFNHKKNTKTTRAQLYIEILCQCPNCDYGLDLFDEHSVRESLGDDHRASNCDIEIKCENCDETFLLTDVDF